MAVSDQDEPLHRDTLSFLAGMKGPVAEAMAAHHEALLDREKSGRMPATPRFVDHDERAFHTECEREMELALAELRRLAPTVACEVLLGVPLLLGQPDFNLWAISTGPNAFGYEIELLSSVASGPHCSASCGAFSNHPSTGNGQATTSAVDMREHLEAALHCLALARRARLAAQLALMSRRGLPPDEEALAAALTETSPPHDKNRAARAKLDALGDALATNWLFERGRFFGTYDYEIAGLIYERLRLGHLPPINPDGLRELARAFLRHWSAAYDAFAKRCRGSGSLNAWLKHPVLLTRPALAKDELDLIIEFLPKVWMDECDLQRVSADAAAWLSEISTPLPVTLREAGPYDPSALRGRPIITSHGRALLAVPHRLETDVTDLLDNVWGPQFGEAYFYARGAVVEDIAFKTLMQLPGATGIRSANYSSEGKSVVGETDGVVVWERTAFVIEAKGGFLSLAARRGDRESANTNIRSTVGEAYWQATRLVRLLDKEGTVRLKGSANEQLELMRSDIDRVHVVIPTADDFGGVASSITELAEVDIIPSGAAPLIAAGQELMLLLDLLADPLDVGAYFLFREELLTCCQPMIRMTDEQEILGSYIAGKDVVGYAKRAVRETRVPNLMFVPDPTMQRYVDAWLIAREQTGTQSTPKRHVGPVQSLAQRLAAEGRSPDAWRLLRAGSDEAGDALHRIAANPTAKPIVAVSHDISVITSRASIPGVHLRRLIREKRAGNSRHVWVFKRSSSTESATLDQVLTPQQPLHEHGLIKTVDPAELTRWYDDFGQKRRKRRGGSREYDEALAAALEQEGLSDSMSRGVCRANLATHVRDTAAHDVPIAKAAAFWLQHVKPEADARGTDVSDLSISPADAAAAIMAIKAGTLTPDRITDALSAVIDREMPIPQFLKTVTPPRPLSLSEIEELVEQVLAAEHDLTGRAATGERRAVDALAGKAMGRAREPKPAMTEIRAAIKRSHRVAADSN